MNAGSLQEYKNANTEDLIRIAFIDKSNYFAEAVTMATTELLSRGITPESEQVIKMSKKNAEASRIQDTVPLTTRYKVLFFICGMVPFLFLMATMALIFLERKKEEIGIRKMKESQKWLWIGLGSFLLILSLAVILRTLFG